MDTTYDRRGFLRRAALAALGAPAVSMWACSAEQPGGADGSPRARQIDRPILMPWEGDAVRIAAPPRERPVMYLSRGLMEIYLDRDFRDRIQYALSAHISVSTGHWRVPLPGDPTNIPIQPGDELREFEEIDMREWNAAIDLTEGDMRIVRGRASGVRVTLTCEPLSGGGVWLGAEPLDLLQAGPPNEELCREDLMEVGTGTRFADRDCTRPIGPARLVTWASREPAIFEGV